MIRKLAFVGTVVAAFAAPLWAKEPLRIVVDPWAPFGGEDLPDGGISLDVVTTVLGKAGFEVETHIVPWERALDGVRDGTYDIISNLFYLPENEEFLTYGSPFYQSEVRFMRKSGASVHFTDLDSLRPYTIAVGAGYFYEDSFDKADHLQKVVVTTVIQGVRMVAAGRVDLTLDSVDVLNYIIASTAPELADQVEVLPTPLASQSIHMAVRNTHPDVEGIITAFNKVLSEMQEAGSLDALLAKHQY